MYPKQDRRGQDPRRAVQHRHYHRHGRNGRQRDLPGEIGRLASEELVALILAGALHIPPLLR